VTESRRGGARWLTLAVIVCAGGAALALWAASRTWVVTQTVRAAPQPPLVTPHSGGALTPLLPALALVALACAGGLLATRSWPRLAVGVVMAIAGAGVAVEAVRTATGTTGVRAVWPTLSGLGAVAIVAAAVLTLRTGRSWPSMGARYERTGTEDIRADVSAAGMWDAIDRGVDPTTAGPASTEPATNQ
jgi:Tryptophan-associated transmembrane protein (Trp_oprn_chp)